VKYQIDYRRNLCRNKDSSTALRDGGFFGTNGDLTKRSFSSRFIWPSPAALPAIRCDWLLYDARIRHTNRKTPLQSNDSPTTKCATIHVTLDVAGLMHTESRARGHDGTARSGQTQGRRAGSSVPENNLLKAPPESESHGCRHTQKRQNCAGRKKSPPPNEIVFFYLLGPPPNYFSAPL